MKRTVTHLIAGLGKGGAETMLYQVLKYRFAPGLEYRVVSMGGGDYFEEPIRKLGIEVKTVRFRHNPLGAILQIARYARGSDVLCCWMYHANFVGYIAGKAAHVSRLIWNIRHSDLSRELNKGMTLRINRMCARWSGNIVAIAYNGNQARDRHEAIGYCHGNGIVMVNGVDVNEYRFIKAARERLLAELGISADRRIVLSVSRYHPIKDVPTFLKAFSLVRRTQGDAVAVLCGAGIEIESEQLVALCHEGGLRINRDVYLLGLRHDIPSLLSACDLYVLHSAGEAFPNTLVQAMACGCLCLTTDVGDAAQILDNPGRVVAVGDAAGMAEGMLSLLTLSETEKYAEQKRNRQRVAENYNIKHVVWMYESLYDDALDLN